MRSEGFIYQDALTKLKEPGMAGNLRKRNYSTHPQSRRNFSTNSQNPRNSNNEASSSLTLSYHDALGKKDSAPKSATAVFQLQTVATQTTSIDACTQTYLTGDNLCSCCNKGTDTEDLPELKINASKQESHLDMLQVFLPKFA